MTKEQNKTIMAYNRNVQRRPIQTIYLWSKTILFSSNNNLPK